MKSRIRFTSALFSMIAVLLSGVASGAEIIALVKVSAPSVDGVDVPVHAVIELPKRLAGVPLQEALLESGRRRFRAVLLTSLTTIAALGPLLFETSFQAQVLIPMANSLCFGLALTTVLVLLLVPVLYSVYARLAMPELFQAEFAPPSKDAEVPFGHDEQIEMLTH